MFRQKSIKNFVAALRSGDLTPSQLVKEAFDKIKKSNC